MDQRPNTKAKTTGLSEENRQTHFRCKDTQTKSEGMGKATPCKWKPKQVHK